MNTHDNRWTRAYNEKDDIAFPAEAVIRIFKGKFPNLDFRSNSYTNKKILDLGAGDGRHLLFLSGLGFEVYGSEITEEIVDKTRKKMQALEIDSRIEVGRTRDLPYENNLFDYLLAWNSCYYMDHDFIDFNIHINEMARVLKKGGYLVCSIPKNTSFIFNNSKDFISDKRYKIIGDEYFGLRQGQVMRCFYDENEIIETFESKFCNFNFSSIEMEWFGLNYHWFVFIAEKK